MAIIIKKGRIINPAQGIDMTGDVLVEKGKISKVAKNIKADGAETISAEGKIVCPGFIDMHTHLREPGKEEAETVETALKAAVCGGFTTVSAMPNTQPVCEKEAHVRFLTRRAEECALGNVLPVGAITKSRAGKDITEMAELKEAGCYAVSDDGDSVPDAWLMRVAMEYASMVDLLVISHCEDKLLAGGGVMHEGYWSTALGLKPIPAESESVIVDRDIQVAIITGARLHIAHVSTAKSVEIIRNAKKRGVKVSAEVTPHHLTLSDESLKTYDTNLKVNPPLRTKEDVKALKEALKDGTIDAIATDHAPHPADEKEREFDYAPFGMIGLETALSLSAMALIDKKYLDWPGLIARLTCNPCKILKYDRGTLKEGANADITIFDPEQEWVYTVENIRSKSKNSPFIGWKLKAKVTDVLVGGKVVLKESKLT